MKINLTTNGIPLPDVALSKSNYWIAQNKGETKGYLILASLQLKLVANILMDIGTILWTLLKLKQLMPYVL